VSRLQGIGWLLGSLLAFATMDVLTRALTADVPAAVVALLRFAVHAIALTLLVFVARRGRPAPLPPLPASPTQEAAGSRSRAGSYVARGLALAAAALCSVLALQRMPVAEYTAIIMVAPLVVTALAVLWLKHRVNASDVLLVAAGFAGALIVIRPGSGLFDSAATMALGVVAGNAAFQLLSNRHGHDEDPWVTSAILGWVALAALLAWVAVQHGLSVATAKRAWLITPTSTLAGLFVIGVLGAAGQSMAVAAFARTPVATLMPFAYLQVPLATGIAWWSLGDRPDTWGWVGLATIVACGVAGTQLAARARQ
jgi:drug/metabolite transporter (DMT)-like permease